MEMIQSTKSPISDPDPVWAENLSLVGYQPRSELSTGKLLCQKGKSGRVQMDLLCGKKVWTRSVVCGWNGDELSTLSIPNISRVCTPFLKWAKLTVTASVSKFLL